MAFKKVTAIVYEFIIEKALVTHGILGQRSFSFYAVNRIPGVRCSTEPEFSGGPFLA